METPVDRDTLAAVLEAVLLTSGRPVPTALLRQVLGEDAPDDPELETLLEELGARLDRPDSGLRIERVAGGWRCATPPQLDPYLQAFHGRAARQKLSQAALEVLAIVGYRQPVTLPEINFIRGVGSSSVVRTLLERKLIRMAGRKNVVGKPFLYRTTEEFLVHFGLERPEDLPEPEELAASEEAPVE